MKTYKENTKKSQDAKYKERIESLDIKDIPVVEKNKIEDEKLEDAKRTLKNGAIGVGAFALGLLFSGCAAEPDRLIPESQQIIVQEKKVVVACKIPPLHCDFKGEYFEPTRKLIDCLKLHKEAIRICNETKIEDGVDDK